MSLILLGFFTFSIATLCGISWLKKLSIKNHWLDTPTDRGSHKHAVPHIGGVVIMSMLFLLTLILMFSGYLSWRDGFIWILILLLLGLVGFIDDIRDLPKRLRLLAQIVIAVVVVWYFGGINSVQLGSMSFEFASFSYLLGFIWVIGFINMYNFMDGINGMAGCQALLAGLIFSVWLFHLNQPGESLLFLGVASTAIGFLYWNFSPAQVFMGDSGSTMLGGLFAAISLQMHNQLELSILFPVMLFAWFLIDTSLTFTKRLVRGEKVWQAHRQHFYQQLAPNPQDHTKVTGMISLFTLIISGIITAVLLKLTNV